MPYTVAIVQASFANLWNQLLLFLPRFVGAVVVFLVGILIASLLKALIMRLSNVLRLDAMAEKLDLKKMIQGFGVTLNIAELLGWIVKWFVLIIFLSAATDILGWVAFSGYLTDVLQYLPNVIVAVIILLVGILVGNFTQNVVKSAVEAAKLTSAEFLSGLAKWAILIFSFMAALVQLQIAEDLIRILFTGLVAMLALAGGLAFGLGGKEQAAKVLTKLKRDISSEE